MVDEKIIFEIISYSGNARAKAYEALKEAAGGNFEIAEKYLKESDEEMLKAHNIQTKLIHEEAQGIKQEISILLIHAQDQLMTSMSERTLIEIMITQYKKLDTLEKIIKGRNEE